MRLRHLDLYGFTYEVHRVVVGAIDEFRCHGSRIIWVAQLAVYSLCLRLLPQPAGVVLPRRLVLAVNTVMVLCA